MDQVDKLILLHLQNQARISMTELGKLVRLSQPAVTERVRRLEESGVIEQYRAIVPPDKIGKKSAAYVLFRTNDCDAFVEFCRSSPSVIECHRISGEYNYLLKVLTESIHELEVFENSIDKFGNSTTLVVLSSPINHKLLEPTLSEDN
ncbi:Lrp/AsnC family transcriptional regulator [Paenibacillus sp. sptzw28]|uniref:Lrp/AsnC family transcriptional regulator n=1 Tax=Paenibacillus sp. sptzw28 TaxID=715179 RepID=UPI001C6ECE66|nr:Lrp/AsnC family transcriptional regulator [Paenibacillus sp. sptzw28]QYR24331.1 Lrp/AsnC family transcriptional regulator [Paenibacillus sp. sptzw28]